MKMFLLDVVPPGNGTFWKCLIVGPQKKIWRHPKLLVSFDFFCAKIYITSSTVLEYNLATAYTEIKGSFDMDLHKINPQTHNIPYK